MTIAMIKKNASLPLLIWRAFCGRFQVRILEQRAW